MSDPIERLLQGVDIDAEVGRWIWRSAASTGPSCRSAPAARSTKPPRFTRWAKAGVWEKVFEELIRDRDNQYLMLDSTLVGAHQQATTGRGSALKKGASIRLWSVPEAD